MKMTTFFKTINYIGYNSKMIELYGFEVDLNEFKLKL